MKMMVTIFKKNDAEPIVTYFERHDCESITGDEVTQHVLRDQAGCNNSPNCTAHGYDYLSLTPFGIIITWDPKSLYANNRVSHFVPMESIADVIVSNA